MNWKKKIDPKKRGCPLGNNNKEDAENLINNGKEIFKIRNDIINA